MSGEHSNDNPYWENYGKNKEKLQSNLDTQLNKNSDKDWLKNNLPQIEAWLKNMAKDDKLSYSDFNKSLRSSSEIREALDYLASVSAKIGYPLDMNKFQNEKSYEIYLNDYLNRLTQFAYGEQNILNNSYNNFNFTDTSNYVANNSNQFGDTITSRLSYGTAGNWQTMPNTQTEFNYNDSNKLTGNIKNSNQTMKEYQQGEFVKGPDGKLVWKSAYNFDPPDNSISFKSVDQLNQMKNSNNVISFASAPNGQPIDLTNTKNQTGVPLKLDGWNNFDNYEDFADERDISYKSGKGVLKEGKESLEYKKEDVLNMAAMMLAEAEIEGDRGMIAVGYAIKNRFRLWTHRKDFKNIFSVVSDTKHSKQFSPWPGEFNRQKSLLKQGNKQHALELAKGVLDGTLPNPIGIATFFQNYKQDRVSGNRQVGAQRRGELCNKHRLGDHIFRTERKYLNRA